MSFSVASTTASTVSSSITKNENGAAFATKKKKILVQNVSTFTTEQALRSLFQPYGRIAYIHLPVNHKGERRFIALVQFIRPDDAALAMVGLQGVRLDYMVLQLEWVHNKNNKATPTKTNNGISPPKNAYTTNTIYDCLASPHKRIVTPSKKKVLVGEEDTDGCLTVPSTHHTSK
jgi:RNA recognition motif-containing protein